MRQNKMVQTKEERKAKKREYDQSLRASVKRKENRNSKRLKVLKHYSKNLSNSDIPCCNCCGENSHLEFLSIDHIMGKKEMDTIKELVKIKYSSELIDIKLTRWIIKNNFPKYFQILCHNCNLSKGYYGNCPLEGKPH